MARYRGLLIAVSALPVLLWGVWQADRFTATSLPDLQLRWPAGRPATRPVAVAASLFNPAIRVSLTPEPVRRVSLEVSGPFEVRTPGAARPLWQAGPLSALSVTAHSRGIRVGEREFPYSRIDIVPQKSPSVWIEGHQYRGTVRLYRRSNSLVQAVNVLPLEDYVASVVDSEMPIEFGAEARKAQAIVARTYALYQMRNAVAEATADVFASVKSQKYLGVQYRAENRLLAAESADSRQVTAATRGLVCLYAGRLFCTYYSAVCGGETMQGSDFFPDAAPPLRSVPCGWCQAASAYRWEVDVPDPEWRTAISRACAQQGMPVGMVHSLQAAQGIPAGRMPRFQVRGSGGTVQLSGADLRIALRAKSPRFTARGGTPQLHLTGKGSGHGVGLCQWGARGMGKAGRTVVEIVQHYYPGAVVVPYEPR